MRKNFFKGKNKKAVGTVPTAILKILSEL